MVVTPSRFDEAENEFNMYTTTTNREYTAKSGFHVSLATTKGIGPRPPRGKMVKMREGAPKDREVAAEKWDGVPMAAKLAKLMSTRRQTGTAHTGGTSQIKFGTDPPAAAAVRRKKPMSRSNPPPGFRSGNGSFINSRPTSVFGNSTDPRSYLTETKSAYRKPEPQSDPVRFKLYLVRDECHVGEEPPLDQPLNAWQTKRLKKTNPYSATGDRFSTICSTTMLPPRPYSAADDAEVIAARSGQNPSFHKLDLRAKLAYLSGRTQRTRPQTSFARTAPEFCDPEQGTERVANPMTLTGKFPGPSTRLETEGQQRASMTHSLHTSQAKGNKLFGTTGRRLVKNPPYCRDGVHPPENTDLQIDGTLPECPPPGSPNVSMWGHLLAAESKGFGGQPATGFAHKLRARVKRWD